MLPLFQTGVTLTHYVLKKELLRRLMCFPLALGMLVTLLMVR